MFKRISLALLLGAALSQAQAASQQMGRFEVHYSVVNTTFVEPDTAAVYQLVRAKDRAFINIAVREKLPEGGDRAVTAKIEGRSWDFFENAYLEFREIREGDAIYYIADFDFNDGEVRFFNLRLLPAGENFSQPLNFHQKIHEE